MKKEIEQKILSLIKKQQSLLLSTIDGKKQNQPYSSYAPYYFDTKEDVFYVLLSDLAEHSQNLIDSSLASILIIEDESNAEQIFARIRVQYTINAEIVTEEEKQEQILSAMEEKFGEVITLIRSLSDFRVFCFKPKNGRYIEGFGKAMVIGEGAVGDLRSAMTGKR